MLPRHLSLLGPRLDARCAHNADETALPSPPH